ncbi:VOC family protein [Rubellicoccus peritrichatus]|uniref:VOC family protein n=1 Tax=Rubellicoccus peritrichatus TaxID=3080537 RepID=A0AAQ3QWV2_9BACT|nr:VOC family protein [Puniceicoccus sp. CR14]WOO42225.1 VOC family protein [Puniceicoccus sp. CR14]
MKVTEIAFVGNPVTDIKRARDFYERILGLDAGEIDEEIAEGQYWIEYAIGDQTLAISNTWEPSGASGPSAALEVDDFDAAMAHLKQEGVNIILEKLETPVCFMGLITDPDGNGLTIHKRK